MHEPDIAPLARRLAEENNVDWRRLPGSGDGGRVVERDVLGYLARVMAGDEAVDPTPEPVPDGMVAWPEDDVTAYGARRDEPPAASPPTLDDELFLFDDPLPGPMDAQADPADDDAAAWLAPAGAGYDDDAPASDDDARASDDDAPASDDDAVLLMGDDVDHVAAPAETGGDDAALDGIRFDEFPDLSESDVDAPEPAWGDGPGEQARAGDALPDLFASGDDGEAHAADHAGPELLFDDAEDVEDEPAREELTLEAPEPPEDAGAHHIHAPDADAADDADPFAGDGEPGADPGADPGDEDFDRVTVAAPPATSGAATIGAAGPAHAPEPSGAVGFAFVRHGQVWRRRFDDRPVRRAVSEVAAELDVSASAVMAVLLARAAVRSGAVTGPVDALRWRRGVPARGTATGEGDLRSAIRAVEAAEPAAVGAATLVVADLSELDLDEAVLHLEAPVLTLGRAAGGDTWLCLAGDDVDGAIVDALAAIAELLSTPVRLLV